MGGKHYWAPLKDPKRILDLGTGTGIWAMEVGTSPLQLQSLDRHTY